MGQGRPPAGGLGFRRRKSRMRRSRSRSFRSPSSISNLCKVLRTGPWKSVSEGFSRFMDGSFHLSESGWKTQLENPKLPIRCDAEFLDKHSISTLSVVSQGIPRWKLYDGQGRKRLNFNALYVIFNRCHLIKSEE